MTKEENSRAIYTASVLCVLSVFIGCYALMQLHQRVTHAESRFDAVDSEMQRYYGSLQLERRADILDYAGRIDRLERHLGIAEPWTGEAAAEYMRRGGR